MESLDHSSQKVLQWQGSVNISMTATNCKKISYKEIGTHGQIYR